MFHIACQEQRPHLKVFEFRQSEIEEESQNQEEEAEGSADGVHEAKVSVELGVVECGVTFTFIILKQKTF